MRLIAPGPATAESAFGAAGGKVSRGVMHVRADGSLSTIVLARVSTVRTTKHCSTPGFALTCSNEDTSSGFSFRGFGASPDESGGEDAA